MTRSNTRAPTFDHYLRTGEWLSDAEWLSRYELKFNPYHDPDDGRFTFAPGGRSVVAGTGRGTGPSRAPATAPSPRVRPVVGYPETGKDAWRKSHDAIFEKAADDFNTENGLKPGDARYMDPQLMKAWAMVESGGNREQFASDPFQVNVGDWAKEKADLGLSKGKAPGVALSAYAALRWLDMKGHTTTVLKNGTKKIVYIGLPRAFMRYNGNNNIDKNGKSHRENYLEAIRKLYRGK